MTDIPDDVMQAARYCTTDSEIASAILTERFRTIVAVIDCFTSIFDQGGATGSRIREMLRENDNVVPGIDFVSLTSACANALFDFEERAILSERASHAAEKAEMVEEIARLREALKDACAHLSGAASAYSTYACRSRAVGKPRPDPFFTTRNSDFQKAADRARKALGETHGNC